MASLAQRFETWRERRDRQRKIAYVAPEAISDCGLRPAEFRAWALMPSEQIARMEHMARINGLDPERLNRDRALQISTALTCTRCSLQRRCREILRNGASRPETDFCPNAKAYRRLTAECLVQGRETCGPAGSPGQDQSRPTWREDA